MSQLPENLTPRLLGKVDAARYLGVADGTFDRLRADGQIPDPLIGGTRQLWHVEQLSLAGFREHLSAVGTRRV